MNDRERDAFHDMQCEIDRIYADLVISLQPLRKILLKEPIVIEREGKPPLLYGAFEDGSWLKEQEVEK